MRMFSGVVCDRRLLAKAKGKVYETAVRPAMTYGVETAGLTKREITELETAELKMLRFFIGVSKIDKIRNKYVWGTAHVRCLTDKVREGRLRWFGHVKRREEDYIGRKLLNMEIPERRARGRPRWRFMDAVKEDMEMAGVSVEDVLDRGKWRKATSCNSKG